MRMYVSYSLLSLVLLSTYLLGMLSAQNTFYKTYDYPGRDCGRAVVGTDDGGFAVVGATNSLGAGNLDVWLLRTKRLGDTLWTKTYGDSGVDEGFGLLEAADRGFIVVGYKTLSSHYADGGALRSTLLERWNGNTLSARI